MTTVDDAKHKADEVLQGAAEQIQDKTSQLNVSRTALLTLFFAVLAIIFGYAYKDAKLEQRLKDLSIHNPVEDWMAKWGQGTSSSYDRTPNRVGLVLAEEGVRAKYPLVIIPGFVTSGLELWSGHECANGLFRSRLWTTMDSVTNFLQNRTCWMTHVSLNFTTGLDPAGIRVRSAQGLDAIDFFFPGYDVWAKAIEAFADIGYDSTTMVAMPYDWRLSIPNMELRDGYFTKLRAQCETFRKVYGERVMLAAHSWGDNVARAFLHWMEEVEPGWVETHVAVHFNVAGPTLGVPKAATSILSGEFRETAQLGGIAHMLGETLLGKEDRTLVWRTWGSSVGMLPMGGRRIWGNSTWAPDDTTERLAMGHSLGSFLTVMETRKQAKNDTETASPSQYFAWLRRTPVNETGDIRYLDVIDLVEAIVRDAGPTFMHHVRHWSSAELPDDIEAIMGHRTTAMGEVDAKDLLDTKGVDPVLAEAKGMLGKVDRPTPTNTEARRVRMYDPLTTPLPDAPSLRIYCGYGYGAPTERAYHYKHSNPESGPGDTSEAESGTEFANNPTIMTNILAEGQISAGTDWHINKAAHAPDLNLEGGLQFGEGDGTVPLTSLGAMCVGGWHSQELNPHGVKVITREYENKMKYLFGGGDMRGGPEASSHVEVLANKHCMADMLYAAAGWHDKIDKDNVTSPIMDIVKRIPWNVGLPERLSDRIMDAFRSVPGMA